MSLDYRGSTCASHPSKKIGGVWHKPRYTQREYIDQGNGEALVVVAGTQFVDGLWRRLRSSTGLSHASDFERIEEMVRCLQENLGDWSGFVACVYAHAG